MGLTQAQFAPEVGVTFSTVNLWENGHRRPQPYLLSRLLQIEESLKQEHPRREERAESRDVAGRKAEG